MSTIPPIARRLILLAPDPDKPSPSLLLDAQGRILERHALMPGSAASGVQLPTVVAVPGERVRTLRLDLPLRNPLQARAAARLQLDGELGSEGDTHLALGEVDAAGTRLAVVVDAAQMLAWQDQLAALGIVADAVLPDHLLLPEPTSGHAGVATLEGRVLVRGPSLAFSAEPGLADAVLAGHPHGPIPGGEEVLALLARGALRPALDLQQGNYARRRGPAGGAPRLRLLTALLIASPLVLVAADALRHELSARWLKQQARTLAADVADPRLARADPLAAVDAQLTRLRGGSGFQGLAATLLPAVRAQPGVRIERLDYADARLQAVFAGGNAGTAAALGDAMRAAGLQALLEDAGRQADGPRTRITLESRK